MGLIYSASNKRLRIQRKDDLHDDPIQPSVSLFISSLNFNTVLVLYIGHRPCLFLSLVFNFNSYPTLYLWELFTRSLKMHSKGKMTWSERNSGSLSFQSLWLFYHSIFTLLSHFLLFFYCLASNKRQICELKSCWFYAAFWNKEFLNKSYPIPISHVCTAQQIVLYCKEKILTLCSKMLSKFKKCIALCVGGREMHERRFHRNR